MSILKLRYLWLLISALVIIPGLLLLARFGFKLSIDFTGGSLLEVSGVTQTLDTESVATALQTIAPDKQVAAVQQSGDPQYLIRSSEITNDQKDQLVEVLSSGEPAPLNVLRFETVGPVLGKELLQKTVTAAIIAATLITLYISYQFKNWRYGICAVLAMLHDTLVLFSIFAWLGWWQGVELDILFVTAIMTTLSFSVHDTIVVFDRIRELRRLHPRLPLIEIADLAVLQTLSRSINNSLTIIIMLLTLVWVGGETIRWFAVALLVGAITGTYSSTFTAVPLLVVWDDLKARWQSRRTK